MELKYLFTCIDRSHGQVKRYEANKILSNRICQNTGTFSNKL